jgi:type VI secretion system secreted protein Hcp
MDLIIRRRVGRAFLVPLVALALIVGFVIYAQTGGSAVRHTGAPAPAAHVPVKKFTAGDLLLAASTAQGIHLEFDGITGAPATTHANHIAITSFQWGVGVQAPPPGGGGSGRPSLSDITLTKGTDRYSVPLLNKSFRAQRTLRAIAYFTGVNSGGVAFDYLEFDLKNVFITGFSLSSGGETPSESLSLNYTALTIIAHITGAPAQTVTYDIASNTTS